VSTRSRSAPWFRSPEEAAARIRAEDLAMRARQFPGCRHLRGRVIWRNGGYCVDCGADWGLPPPKLWADL
jgi:hypothetical protein